MLGELIDLFSNVGLHDGTDRARDLLGRVYEYFLGGFASSEGKRGGEFFTPRSVVRTLVEMLEPFQGRVYDPCCGSGGMFVQSEKFIEDSPAAARPPRPPRPAPPRMPRPAMRLASIIPRNSFHAHGSRLPDMDKCNAAADPAFPDRW